MERHPERGWKIEVSGLVVAGLFTTWISGVAAAVSYVDHHAQENSVATHTKRADSLQKEADQAWRARDQKDYNKLYDEYQDAKTEANNASLAADKDLSLTYILGGIAATGLAVAGAGMAFDRRPETQRPAEQPAPEA